jgi:hypothetical protein
MEDSHQGVDNQSWAAGSADKQATRIFD